MGNPFEALVATPQVVPANFVNTFYHLMGKEKNRGPIIESFEYHTVYQQGLTYKGEILCSPKVDLGLDFLY